MEPLPHGLWSCSSKPWTGRTGKAEGRFSYWNYWRYTLSRTLPLPDKEIDAIIDMPCWLHSIEATTTTTPAPAGTTTNHGLQTDTCRRQTSHRVFASHLDIQDYAGHQDYQPPTLTTDYFLARLPNGNPSTYQPITFYGISHLATNSSTPIHVHPSTLGGSSCQSMRSKNLATKLHRSANIMEVLYF